MKRSTLKILLGATLAILAHAQSAQAAGIFEGSDIDPRFRAKIMKEKAKQNVLMANTFNFNAQTNPNPQCGSQNIGNVDTGGRIGTAPREIFVFAPNAVNLVSGFGCK